MKYADVSGLSHKDLNKKTKELRGQMFEARMKNSLGQLTNPMSIREMRRDVARMKTALSAKAATTPPPAKKTVAAKAPTAKKAVKAKSAAKGK